MYKKISSLFTLFFILTLSLFFPIQADADWIIGYVYLDEGTVPMPDGRKVTLIVNDGDSAYSTTLQYGNGAYGWAGNVISSPGDILTVFLDDEEEKGTTVTRTHGGHILDLDIYQNHVIARSDQSGVELTIADMATYDNDDNPDIKFTAATIEITDSLEVDDDNVFYIWPESTLAHSNFIGGVVLDDITIKGTYEIDTTWAFILVSGSWDNSGTYINDAPNGAVGFHSDSGEQENIKSGGFSFMQDVGFDDGGAGTTWVLEDTLEVRASLQIDSGTLDTKAAVGNTIKVGGSWIIDTDNGTFEARNGTVILDNDAANSSSITSGGSAFYNLEINSNPAATYNLEDTLDVDNNLTISAGTLDTNPDEDNAIYVAGNWDKDNSATFEARSGTVTFDGTGAQNVTTGGSNWSGIEVTNDSGDVNFLDKFTCETFTCTTPGSHLNFKYKETDEAFVITASGGLTLQGDSGDYVYLGRYQGSGDNQWYINPSGGSWTVDYVDVADSFNSHRLYINPLHYNKSGNNNYNWFAQEECITQIYPASSIVGSGELVYFSASNGGDCGSEPSYSWEVTSDIGSAINPDGIYISGDNDTSAPTTDTVTVTDDNNGVTDTATVRVGDMDCAITISPSSKIVSSGESIQFSAENEGCALEASYSWKVVSTIGSSINNGSGLYRAGTNNTPNDITETVTVTDSANCVIGTATVEVKGRGSVITTTIPGVDPATTTTTPSTTTTPPLTTTTTPTTTTTTMICEVSISPPSASVNPGESVTFEVTLTGICNSPHYEWSLSSDTDSSIESQGSTCIYTAGLNESSEPLTDIITLTDTANGDATTSATITVAPNELQASMRVSPDSIMRSNLLLRISLMHIEGINTHFNMSSSINFYPANAVFPLGKLVINNTNIYSLILVLPSWLTGAENENVTVTVTTGEEVVSDTFDVELLPSLLDE